MDKHGIWQRFLSSKGLDISGDEPLPPGTDPQQFFSDWEDFLLSRRTTYTDGVYQIDGMDHILSVKGGKVSWINGPAVYKKMGNPQPTPLPVTAIVDLLGVDRVDPQDDTAGYVSSQKLAAGATRTNMPDGVYQIRGMDHILLIQGGHVSWINGPAAYRQLGNPHVSPLPVSAIVDVFGVGRVIPQDDIAGYVSSQEKAPAQGAQGMTGPSQRGGWRRQ